MITETKNNYNDDSNCAKRYKYNNICITVYSFFLRVEKLKIFIFIPLL